MAGDQIGHRRRRALVVDRRDLRAAHHLEQLGGEMRCAAGIGGAVIELAGIRLGRGDHLGDRICRERGIRQHHHRLAADHRHRDEIAHRVIGQLGDQRRVGDVGDVDERQRVPVGRRLRHQLGGDDRARAGAVLDHELLPERFGELRRHRARHGVGRAARRHADQHLDRLGRESLDERLDRDEKQSERERLHAGSSPGRSKRWRVVQ